MTKYKYSVYVGCNIPSGGAYPPNVVESAGLRSCPFDCCCTMQLTGAWKKEKEHTVVFEYVGEKSDKEAVMGWAERLKSDFSQEAVMVTCSRVRLWLV